MTKDQLTKFAEAGVALKIAEIERELAEYHHQWPQLFLSATPPQLLKVPARANGNGHWPPVVMTKEPRATAEGQAARVALLQAYLTAVDSASMAQIRQHLAEHRQPLSNTSVQKLLHRIPNAIVVGTGARARWVLRHKLPTTTVPSEAPPTIHALLDREPPQKKRTLSLAARKKLAAAMRRRHATGEIARARAKAAKARAAKAKAQG
jgi:hypothetical protein